MKRMRSGVAVPLRGAASLMGGGGLLLLGEEEKGGEWCGWVRRGEASVVLRCCR